MSSKAKQDLLHRLNADEYSSEELIVLTTPLSLPYPIQQNGYERAEGEFEYQGEYYHMVKQKIENDTLFLVCIKDHHQKILVNAMSEYTNLANSLPSSAQHTMDLLGKLFKDYTSISSLCLISSTGWSLDVAFAEMNASTISKHYPVVSPPPEVC